MSRGYAEGPALEERLAALDQLERGGERTEEVFRQAVYGSTPDRREKHFIGWIGEVDPDTLFDSGSAWGLSIVRKAEQG